jgi:hypothetical protein
MCQQQCVTGGRTAAIGRWAAAATILVALATAPVAYGQTVTQGPLSPAGVVDDPSFGGAGWFPPGNAIASDDAWAQVAPGGSPTHYLKATNFNFSIPAPAEIRGIEVLVERRSGAGSIVDSRARIVKGGTVGSADRALPGTWPTTDTIVTYGSPTDLWGETWTPADINNTNFGFALSVFDNVDVAAVDHIQIRVTYALCASAPAAGCRSAQKSVLIIKDNTDNTRDKLVWKWIKGQSTTQADFGDPVVSSSTALCIYDNGALIGGALVAPVANWQVVTTKGWKFLDKSGTQTGIQKVVLTGNTANKAKALMKGKGVNLADIAPPLAGPVTVQMVSSDTGICWESQFTTFIKNQVGLYKAKDL